MFPFSYRNTSGSLENLKIAVKAIALWSCVLTEISYSPKLPLVFSLLYGSM